MYRASQKIFLLITCLAIIGLRASVAQAQLPQLVDALALYPGTLVGNLGATLGGKYMTDSLGSLMISDGTDTGTYSVKNFYALEAMTVANNKLFMIASDSPGHTGQLWASDGTNAGTYLVKAINHIPDSGGVYYFDFTDYSMQVYNNRVYFFADDNVHGAELWRSDGTDTGTVIVKDINTAPAQGIIDLPNFPFGQFAVANNLLFFTADDGIHGAELWRTDGTAANTVIVADLWPGAQGANPQYLTPFGNKLCFWASNGVGKGLYITDGTDTGTHLLKANIFTPNSDATVAGNLLFFFADSISTPGNQGLWVTDGTAAGTQMLRPLLYSTIQYSFVSYFSNFLHTYNGKAYFGAADNLWVSDGTSAGTQLLKTFAAEPGLCCTPTQITDFNGKMYMRVRDFNGRVEICASDGTDTGTVLPGYPGSDFASSDPIVYNRYLSYPLTVAGGQLFFWNTYQVTTGHSLFKIGTAAESVVTPVANTGLQIYPNPATDLLNIAAPGGEAIEKVELWDENGRLLKSARYPGNKSCVLSTEDITAGVATLQVFTASTVYTRTIVFGK